MSECIRCGSGAVNTHAHGRDPRRNVNLCDVCYWRTAHAELEKKNSRNEAKIMMLKENIARLEKQIGDFADPGNVT